MSIQYAGGTIVNQSFAQSAGTRAELADWIKDQLVTAGWTSSGSASDYKVTSATTPQSLSAKVRVYDPGSGNCARLKFSNAAESKVQAGDCFLLPAASKAWQIIANKYQFFVFVPGASVAREFAAGGSPYVHGFNGVTEAVWGGGNSITDTGSATYQNMRMAMGFCGGASNAANSIGLVNGTLVEANNIGLTGNCGHPQLYGLFSGVPQEAISSRGIPQWFNGDYALGDALIGWTANTSGANQPRIVGQLWDALLFSGAPFANDGTFSFDGHTFQAITNQIINYGGNTGQVGQLCVAIN